MFCRNCGKQNPDSAVFCVYCGASMNTNTSNAGMPQVNNIPNNYGNTYGAVPNQGMVPNYNPYIVKAKSESKLSKYFEKRKPNIPGVISSTLLFATTFMPLFHCGWYPYDFGNEFVRFDADFSDVLLMAFMIVAAVAALVCSIFDKSIGISISALAGIVFIVIVFIDKADRAKWTEWVTLASGFWFLIVSTVLLIGSAIYGFIRYQKVKKQV